MNKATIQKILNLTPIANADKIELAKVQGWEVVVNKGLHNIGDYIVFVSIDTIVPDQPEFEFLRDRNFRVRTIKLRGQISQGLILPLNILPLDMIPDAEYNEGFDVSDILGITHYEKPLPLELTGMAFGSFPSFLQKTDEEMVQSCLGKLAQLQGQPYYITIKIDGMSGTFFRTVDKFGVCSRKLELKDHENNVFWKMARKYGLDTLVPGIYAQGEVAGPGIQKNKLGLKEVDLFIFNLRYIEGNKPVAFAEMKQTLEYPGRCKMVPVIASGDSFSLKLEDLIELAGTVKYDNGAAAEGIVVRSQDGLISFKVMNNSYLLKNQE